MRLLLDTHVLFWWLTNDERLNSKIRSVIDEAEVVFVSAASTWEMGIKASAGKLNAPDDLVDQLRRHRFTELPVSIAHAQIVAQLPPHHKDPFDRMLVAQAKAESLTLLTADRALARYECQIVQA